MLGLSLIQRDTPSELLWIPLPLLIWEVYYFCVFVFVVAWICAFGDGLACFDECLHTRSVLALLVFVSGNFGFIFVFALKLESFPYRFYIEVLFVSA